MACVLLELQICFLSVSVLAEIKTSDRQMSGLTAQADTEVEAGQNREAPPSSCFLQWGWALEFGSQG